MGPELVAEADSYSVNEDHTLTVNAANGLLENDFDSSGPFEAISFSAPAHGTLSVVGSGSFVYTPDAGFVGDDTFTYTDGDGTNTSSATVTIDVDHGNPVANPDTYLVEAGKTLTVPAATGLLANDIATDGTLEAISFSSPAHGTLSVVSDGSFVYTPTPGFVGKDTFTYTESDRVATASALVTIDVVDAPPIANNDAYVVRAGKTLTVDTAQGLLAAVNWWAPILGRIGRWSERATTTTTANPTFCGRTRAVRPQSGK
jgi:phosphohistidine swiveling domain-containing protein